MATMLDRVSRFARDYRGDADSAWETIRHEHDRAMMVHAIDAVVEFGCFVLTIAPQNMNFWYKWVSEDISRYDEEQQKALEICEVQIIEGSQVVVELIKRASTWGYQVDREDEFRQLLSGYQRWSDAEQLPTEAIRDAKLKALDDHRAGRTVEISEW